MSAVSTQSSKLVRLVQGEAGVLGPAFSRLFPSGRASHASPNGTPQWSAVQVLDYLEALVPLTLGVDMDCSAKKTCPALSEVQALLLASIPPAMLGVLKEVYTDDAQLLRLVTFRINRAVKGCVAKQLEERFPALLRASTSGPQQHFQSLGKTGETCHVTLDVVDDRGRRSFLNATVEISSHTQSVKGVQRLLYVRGDDQGHVELPHERTIANVAAISGTPPVPFTVVVSTLGMLSIGEVPSILISGEPGHGNKQLIGPVAQELEALGDAVLQILTTSFAREDVRTLTPVVTEETSPGRPAPVICITLQPGGCIAAITGQLNATTDVIRIEMVVVTPDLPAATKTQPWPKTGVVRCDANVAGYHINASIAHAFLDLLTQCGAQEVLKTNRAMLFPFFSYSGASITQVYDGSFLQLRLPKQVMQPPRPFPSLLEGLDLTNLTVDLGMDYAAPPIVQRESSWFAETAENHESWSQRIRVKRSASCANLTDCIPLDQVELPRADIKKALKESGHPLPQDDSGYQLMFGKWTPRLWAKVLSGE